MERFVKKFRSIGVAVASHKCVKLHTEVPSGCWENSK